MRGQLHALTPIGVDADGDAVLHAPVLWMDRDIYVPRCAECGLPAGMPYADFCALGRWPDGTPRKPELYAGWLVFWGCRDVACCVSERCERSHLVRHTVALGRERARKAA